MNRLETVLAAMAAAGENATFSPVQVQKLFFLIDREAAAAVGGPHFNFTPYDYGPFDSTVYSAIGALEAQGSARTVPMSRYRSYSLTAQGYQQGVALLNALPESTKEFMQSAANWVRSLSFSQLVSAIYQHFPEMKANSVFRE